MKTTEKKRRSSFSWNDNCFICNEKANKIKEQKNDENYKERVHQVNREYTKDSILSFLRIRNDINNKAIYKRISSVDLVAVQAKYHARCYKNLFNHYWYLKRRHKYRASQQRRTTRSRHLDDGAFSPFTDSDNAEFTALPSNLEKHPNDLSSTASTLSNTSDLLQNEEIECSDVVELARHEAILAQKKKNVETAQAINQKNVQLKSQRLGKSSLVEECRQYQVMMRRGMDELIKKLEKVEEEKRLIITEQDRRIHDLEAKISQLRQELSDERMKMTQSSSRDLVDTHEMTLSDNDDYIQALEPKKVTLESAKDPKNCLRRLGKLKNENNSFCRELRSIQKNKETVKARVETLETKKVLFEIELSL